MEKENNPDQETENNQSNVYKTDNDQDEKAKAEPTHVEPQIVTKIIHYDSAKSSGDIVWALFLIFGGIMLFFNTTGIVSWNVWLHLFRYWPVLLILVGVQIIAGKSVFSKFLVGIITLAFLLIFGATALITAQPSFIQSLNISLPNWWIEMNADQGKMVEFEKVIAIDDYEDIEKRNLNLEIGVGSLSIIDDDSDDFFMLQSSHFENFGKPIVSESQNRADLTIDLKQESKQVFSLPSDGPEYNVSIGQSNLDSIIYLTIGAGQGTIELEQQKNSKIVGNVGAGQLSLELGSDAIPTDELNLEVGAGKIELTLPEEVGYKILYDLGAGTIEIDGIKIQHVGSDNKTYTSANYDDAKSKLTIKLDVGVGTFQLNTK